MKKSPIIHAVLASAYIGLVACIPYFSQNLPEPQNSILGPIAFISVFTLSASIMAFLFFYEPVALLLENKKVEAAHFLLKTIGAFAVITATVLLSLLALTLI